MGAALRFCVGFVLWVLMLVADMASTLITVVLAPILPAFLQDNDRLPAWLAWFQTPDDDALGSAEGSFVAQYGTWPRYWRCMMWLLRNPAYGFGWSVLSARVPTGTPMWVRGNPLIRNTPTLVPGWFFMLQGRWFVFYVVVPSFPGRCFRMRLGWKLTADGDNSNAMYACSLNPWMHID